MKVKGQVCPKCLGSGHDKKGAPVVKMVPFNAKDHRTYITDDDGEVQHRFHQTIKQGSGCLGCGGLGVLDVEVV